MSRGRVYRPNKIAQGMSDTWERSKGRRGYRGVIQSHDVLRLLVYGTCDPLANSMRPIGKSKCPCCNGTGRAGYHLTDSGKLRLRKLRRAKVARDTVERSI